MSPSLRQEDIETFDMHGVALEDAGSLISLTVPGLAENRPSVLRGDAVVVQRPGDERQFRGYAHQVLLTYSLLLFTDIFLSQYSA